VDAEDRRWICWGGEAVASSSSGQGGGPGRGGGEGRPPRHVDQRRGQLGSDGDETLDLDLGDGLLSFLSLLPGSVGSGVRSPLFC
jgi:hypothetical protein